MKEREAKLARGEKVGPPEQDPTAEPEVGVLGFLKFLVYLLLFIVLTGKFVTGELFWGYDGKWVHLNTYWPVCFYTDALSCSGVVDLIFEAARRREALYGGRVSAL
jgi:hypothetical protein